MHSILDHTVKMTSSAFVVLSGTMNMLQSISGITFTHWKHTSIRDNVKY